MITFLIRKTSIDIGNQRDKTSNNTDFMVLIVFYTWSQLRPFVLVFYYNYYFGDSLKFIIAAKLTLLWLLNIMRYGFDMFGSRALSQIELKCPAVRNFHRISAESHDKILLRVFDVCLEIPSESKHYFSFVVEELSKYTTNSKDCRHLENKLRSVCRARISKRLNVWQSEIFIEFLQQVTIKHALYPI